MTEEHRLEMSPERMIEALKNEIRLRDTKIAQLDKEIEQLKKQVDPEIDFVIVDGMAFKSFQIIYKG